MKKILYISYDGMTDPLGQSQVIPYLQGLSGENLEITILSCEKKNNFSNRFSEIKTLLERDKIRWVPIVYTSWPPVFSTIYDVWKLKRKAAELHEINSFSFVHCRSYIAALAGQYLKRKFGIKFIFDMRGFWADERVDGKIWNLNHPHYYLIYKYFKKKEKEFLKEADYIVTLTEAAKKEITNWAVSSSPIHVIPCCSDTDLFNSKNISVTQKEQVRKNLMLSDGDEVISYLGTIGTWYMLDEMLAFFKLLSANRPSVKFFIITPESPDVINKCAEKRGIPKEKILIRSAERKEVPTMLSISSFSIFFIKPTYSKMASSPTKMGEILSMGIPVICNSGVGDVDKMMNGKTGISIKRMDSEDYLEAIKKIEEFQVYPEEIREVALSFFSLKNGVEAYKQIYSV